jgi:hypothetical protein
VRPKVKEHGSSNGCPKGAALVQNFYHTPAAMYGEFSTELRLKYLLQLSLYRARGTEFSQPRQ